MAQIAGQCRGAAAHREASASTSRHMLTETTLPAKVVIQWVRDISAFATCRLFASSLCRPGLLGRTNRPWPPKYVRAECLAESCSPCVCPVLHCGYRSGL